MAQADVANTSKRNGHVRVPEDVDRDESRASLLRRVVRELSAQAQRRIPKADLERYGRHGVAPRVPGEIGIHSLRKSSIND